MFKNGCVQALAKEVEMIVAYIRIKTLAREKISAAAIIPLRVGDEI